MACFYASTPQSPGAGVVLFNEGRGLADASAISGMISNGISVDLDLRQDLSGSQTGSQWISEWISEWISDGISVDLRRDLSGSQLRSGRAFLGSNSISGDSASLWQWSPFRTSNSLTHSLLGITSNPQFIPVSSCSAPLHPSKPSDQILLPLSTTRGMREGDRYACKRVSRKGIMRHAIWQGGC